MVQGGLGNVARADASLPYASGPQGRRVNWRMVMFLAIVSVSALIWLVLGRREAAVVLIAIPVTLALTLFMFFLYGYTLNRITLFALIFSIGILVDDAIVVVENVERIMSEEGLPPREATRRWQEGRWKLLAAMKDDGSWPDVDYASTARASSPQSSGWIGVSDGNSDNPRCAAPSRNRATSSRSFSRRQ